MKCFWGKESLPSILLMSLMGSSGPYSLPSGVSQILQPKYGPFRILEFTTLADTILAVLLLLGADHIVLCTVRTRFGLHNSIMSGMRVVKSPGFSYRENDFLRHLLAAAVAAQASSANNAADVAKERLASQTMVINENEEDMDSSYSSFLLQGLQ
ncbi:hypothetical protein WN51_10321 [Melipona quadrifasciata]|uniref:Uncharacterized protein n=1 Tax=Melipona quadrifasciata TaxID=166423 RepID=A0A0M8ZN37_9HYME|nr:hypothetical protein WN51_10321 [Melipona quadrifasciata]